MARSRTCTILFTDLVGSTELRTRLGDDAFDVHRRAHEQLLADAIDRHDGEVVKHEGDGVMAVFASAVDALACSVEVQHRVARDRSRGGPLLEVRVGMSAGDVVDEEGDYHGLPVVEAARLCDAAAAGQVLAADVVRVLAGSRGGHELAPVGALELKGLAAPVVAWEVTWSTDTAGRPGVPVRLAEVAERGRCVGRDPEVAEIVEAWKRVTTGERRLVLVAGEPGIGKTRLAAEIAARAVDHGGLALHGWCDEELGAPFQPWAQAIGAYVRATEPTELAAVLAGIADDLAGLVPEVADLAPAAEAPLSLGADAERERIVHAVDVFMERVSAVQPLLVVLDDLHWADRPTLALLQRMLKSDRPGAVLFLGTYRDTDVDRRHPLSAMLGDLRREPRAARLGLGGLDEHGLGAMLADRAGHEAPEPFVHLLHDGTDGNPFFVEEVIAHLVETGTIFQRDGIWTADLEAGQIGLPEGVRDVVGRRLSMLDDSANELLSVAAIVGREWDLSTVLTAGRFDRDPALDDVDAALARGLLVEVAGSTGRYAFSHALVRQTLEEEIGGPRRARLHWRVGEALTSRHDAPRAVIAFHLCEGVLAGDAAMAAEAATDAAEEASAIGAAEDALALAKRAQDVLRESDTDRPDLACRCGIIVGETHAALQLEAAPARAAVTAAAELAIAHGWPELAARAAFAYNRLFVPGGIDPMSERLVTAALELGGGEWRPALLAGVAFRHLVEEDRPAEGAALLAEVEDAARTAHPTVRAAVANMRTTALWADPDVAWLERASQEGLALSEQSGDTVRIRDARTSLVMAALRRGDRAAFRRESDLLARLGHDRGTYVPLVDLWEGTEALLDARFADAEHLAGALLDAVAPDSGYFFSATAQLAATWYWTGRDADLLGAMDLFVVDHPGARQQIEAIRASTPARRGDREAALRYFEPLAADRFASLTHDFWRPGVLCHLANTVMWLGDADRAPDLVALLAAYEGQLLVAAQACLVFDSADALRGALLDLLGRHDEAVACGEAAVALCERAGCVPTAVKSSHQLARSLVTRGAPGDRERARALAADALVRAEALGLAPDVRFARAILDDLGAA